MNLLKRRSENRAEHKTIGFKLKCDRIDFQLKKICVRYNFTVFWMSSRGADARHTRTRLFIEITKYFQQYGIYRCYCHSWLRATVSDGCEPRTCVSFREHIESFFQASRGEKSIKLFYIGSEWMTQYFSRLFLFLISRVGIAAKNISILHFIMRYCYYH